MHSVFRKTIFQLVLVMFLINETVAGERVCFNTYPSPARGMGLTGAIINGMSLGVNVGTSLFYGDLAMYNVWPKFKDSDRSYQLGYSLFIQKNFSKGLGCRINLNQANIRGTKEPLNKRLVDFEGNYISVTIQGVYNLDNIVFKKNRSPKYSIDVFAGIGTLGFRSYSVERKTNYVTGYIGYTNVEGSPDDFEPDVLKKTERLIKLAVPLGINVRYKISHHTSIHLDFTFVNTNTDWLDAWERDYSEKDKYSYLGIGLTYNFGKEKPYRSRMYGE